MLIKRNKPMKYLSDIEKNYIKKFCENQSNLVADFLYEILKDSCIELENNQLNLYLTKEEDVFLYQENMFHFFSLLQTLEEKNYIHFFRFHNDPKGENNHGELQKNSEGCVSYEIKDNKLISLYKEYNNKSFFVDRKLKEFLINGFITEEDLKFQKTIKWTKYSVIASIILTAITIVISLFEKINICCCHF